MSNLPEKVSAVSQTLDASVKPPWVMQAMTAQEFVPTFVRDLGHVTSVLRGECSYHGLQSGTMVSRMREGLQLVKWVAIQRDVRDLRVIATQARLTTQQVIRNSRGGSRAEHTLGPTKSRLIDS